MKNRLLAAFLALIVSTLFSFTQAQDINLTGYTLTFDDEFNALSATSTSPKGASTWYTQPLNSYGYYSESTWDIASLSTSAGILSDKAFTDGSGNWHSGELLSVDPTAAGFTQTYGYFEIRCQMPASGTGAWPAFWLDTTSGIAAGNNEEVDIFEWYGTEYTNPGDLLQQTSHNWNSDGSQNTTTAPYLPSTSTPIPSGAYPWQGYHVYGVLIDPVHMTWYIDGVQTNQCATPTTYMTTPFFILERHGQ
jgi:beta-glucanase (GH16 family)